MTIEKKETLDHNEERRIALQKMLCEVGVGLPKKTKLQLAGEVFKSIFHVGEFQEDSSRAAQAVKFLRTGETNEQCQDGDNSEE